MRRTRSFVLAAAAVVGAATLTACGNASEVAAAAPRVDASRSATAPTTSASPAQKTTATPAKSSSKKKTTPATSDLTELKRAGIGLGEGIILDVADDGVDRFLQVGSSAVDFTGTGRTDSTMMSLQPASVRAKNRVVIKPPFWNEDLGDGYCVADTSGAPLKLEICEPGKASQIWRVALAGDSGQFELHGAYGVIRVEDGKITTAGSGRTGLQTLPY